MDQLHFELVERHMTLMFIEVIVFVITLSVCLGRHKRPLVVQPAAPPFLEEKKTTLKEKPPEKTAKVQMAVKVKGHIRAASMDVTPARERALSLNTEQRRRTDTERTKSGGAQ